MTWLKLAPYLVMAGILAVLAILLVVERGKADDAIKETERLNAQVDGLLKINADQGAAIARLTNQRQIDDKFVTALTSDLAALRDEAGNTTQALSDLRATDPDAKTFLDTALPDSVKRLYGGKAPGNSSPSASAPGTPGSAASKPR